MSPAVARGQHAAKCHIGFCERYVLSDYGTTTKVQWQVNLNGCFTGSLPADVVRTTRHAADVPP